MRIDLPIPKKIWKVKSNSIPNTYHQVILNSKDELSCTCTAGKFKNICRHIKLVKEHINGNK